VKKSDITSPKPLARHEPETNERMGPTVAPVISKKRELQRGVRRSEGEYLPKKI
jgi:hypothetical protein